MDAAGATGEKPTMPLVHHGPMLVHVSKVAYLELQEFVLFELERVLVNGDERIELLYSVYMQRRHAL